MARFFHPRVRRASRTKGAFVGADVGLTLGWKNLATSFAFGFHFHSEASATAFYPTFAGHRAPTYSALFGRIGSHKPTACPGSRPTHTRIGLAHTRTAENPAGGGSGCRYFQGGVRADLRGSLVAERELAASCSIGGRVFLSTPAGLLFPRLVRRGPVFQPSAPLSCAHSQFFGWLARCLG